MKNIYRALLFISFIYNNVLFSSTRSAPQLNIYTDKEANKEVDPIGFEAFTSASQAIIDNKIEKVRDIVTHRPDVRFMVDKSKATLLHLAVFYSRTTICQFLLEKGSDIDSQATNGVTPLHLAVKQELSDIVELLIKNGAAVNKKTALGNEPLFIAVAIDTELIAKQICKLLLDGGANVNLQDNEGLTPLYLAIDRGSRDIVKLLISNGAAVNSKTKGGQEPLHYVLLSSEKNTTKVILEHLIEAGANINAQDNNGATPLFIAIFRGSKDAVEFLISRGAAVNLKDKLGRTPLHFAIQFDKLDISKFLIQKGANIHVKTDEGLTPLQYTIGQSNRPLCELLLENGADLEVLIAGHLLLQKGIDEYCLGSSTRCTNREICALLIPNRDQINQVISDSSRITNTSYFNGKVIASVTLIILTVFLWKFCFSHLFSKPVSKDIFKAVQDNDIRTCEKLLKSIRGAACLRNNNSNTALHEACIHGHKEICALLLKNGAPINALTKDGLSPLMLAATNARCEIAELLLQQDNLNKQFKNHETGETALFIACMNNDVELCNLMLRYGFDPNERTKKNISLLHGACLKDSEELLALFLKYQEDINAQDYQGKTALHYACSKGSNILVQKLLTVDSGNKIQVNLPDNSGNSPLFYAIENNSLEKVRLLVKYGAEIEKQHLIRAIKARSVEVFRVLRATTSSSLFNQIKNQLSVLASGHDEFKIFFDNYQLLPLDPKENQDGQHNSFSHSSGKLLQDELTQHPLEDHVQRYSDKNDVEVLKNAEELHDQVSEGDNDEAFEGI